MELRSKKRQSSSYFIVSIHYSVGYSTAWCELAHPDLRGGGASRRTVENQRSPRLSRCPSEVAGVGGRGGRRLLTIWIVLLADWRATDRWREGEGTGLGAHAGVPAGSSPIWVSPVRRDGEVESQRGSREETCPRVGREGQRAGTEVVTRGGKCHRWNQLPCVLLTVNKYHGKTKSFSYLQVLLVSGRTAFIPPCHRAPLTNSRLLFFAKDCTAWPR